MALCAGQVGKGQVKLSPEEEAARKRYVAQAIQLLQELIVTREFTDFAKIQREPAFQALRGEPDFIKLLSDRLP